MIRRFKEPGGQYLTKIIGQDRLAFAMTDTSDLYDLIEWAQRGGYQGSNIQFYDFTNGNVYRPFEKKRDVIYADPAYFDGFYYVLQGDYADKKVRLYKYIPEEILDLITELNLDEVDLFNMRLAGDKIHIISQHQGMFNCYYPENFCFSIEPNESVTLIDDGKVYIDAWIEEGWDDENDCATDDYKYYGKVIIKDFQGNTISEEIGSLYQGQDGTWWIA